MADKNYKLAHLKCNENMHKKESGSDYVVSEYLMDHQQPCYGLAAKVKFVK